MHDEDEKAQSLQDALDEAGNTVTNDTVARDTRRILCVKPPRKFCAPLSAQPGGHEPAEECRAASGAEHFVSF